MAIQSLRSSHLMQSYFGRLVCDCRHLLSDLNQNCVSVNFIKRSANDVAHFLAKSTSVVADCKLGVHDLPTELQVVLLNDFC